MLETHQNYTHHQGLSMKESLQRYPMTYTIEFHNPGLTREQIELKEGFVNGSDGVVVLHEVFSNGKVAQIPMSIDGKTKQAYPPDRLWYSWLALTKYLTDIHGLNTQKKNICNKTLKIIEENKQISLSIDTTTLKFGEND